MKDFWKENVVVVVVLCCLSRWCWIRVVVASNNGIMAYRIPAADEADFSTLRGSWTARPGRRSTACRTRAASWRCASRRSLTCPRSPSRSTWSGWCSGGPWSPLSCTTSSRRRSLAYVPSRTRCPRVPSWALGRGAENDWGCCEPRHHRERLLHIVIHKDQGKTMCSWRISRKSLQVQFCINSFQLWWSQRNSHITCELNTNDEYFEYDIMT